MPAYRAEDGSMLYYDVAGDHSAGPVVVLAGGAACHPSYMGDLGGLGRRHRLVVPHLRGVGRSPHPDRAELGSFWRQAADVEALRSHLGIERTVLIGHSAGTRLAIAYAAQFPEQVAALLLITPPTAYLVDEPSDAEPLIDKRRGEPAFDAALAAHAAGPDTSSNETFNDWQQAIAPFSYAVWGDAERAHARAGHWDLLAARAYFSVEPPPDLAATLQRVSAPVLVVAGADDCGTGRAPMEALARLFEAGQLAVIDRCGHFPWVEQPAAFAAAAEAFLDAVPTTRA